MQMRADDDFFIHDSPYKNLEEILKTLTLKNKQLTITQATLDISFLLKILVGVRA
jgi:hypothetical protein